MGRFVNVVAASKPELNVPSALKTGFPGLLRGGHALAGRGAESLNLYLGHITLNEGEKAVSSLHVLFF